jgi:hypothetical protein
MLALTMRTFGAPNRALERAPDRARRALEVLQREDVPQVGVPNSLCFGATLHVDHSVSNRDETGFVFQRSSRQKPVRLEGGGTGLGVHSQIPALS